MPAGSGSSTAWSGRCSASRPSGEREQHAKFDDDTPCGTGILPDGRLVVLTMFRKRLMTYADGKLSLYADLSGIATGTIDDMIVDGLGPRLCRRSRLRYAAAARSRRCRPHHSGDARRRGARGRRRIAVSQRHRRLGRQPPARRRRNGWRVPRRLRHRAERRLEVSWPLRKHEVSRWHLPRPRRRRVGRGLRRRRLHSPRPRAGANCSG